MDENNTDINPGLEFCYMRAGSCRALAIVVTQALEVQILMRSPAKLMS